MESKLVIDKVMFAITHGESSTILFRTISTTKRGAIDSFMYDDNCSETPSWSQLKSMGFKCIKIKLVITEL